MSTTNTKLMLATGVISCLGVSALPLGATFASETADFVLDATVDTSVSIEVTSGGSITQEVMPGGQIVTATTSLKISTNDGDGYTLSVNGTGGQTALCKSGVDNCTINIPTVTSENAVAVGNSAWGITGDSTADAAFNTGINAVPATAETLKANETNITDDPLTVTYSFSASQTQSSGQYTGSVTYTLESNS